MTLPSKWRLFIAVFLVPLLVAACQSGAITDSPTASSQTVTTNVASVYGWQATYREDVDGLIESSRRMGMWSGSKNRASEPRRLRRIKELLYKNKRRVLREARMKVDQEVGSRALRTHLERRASNRTTSRDRAISKKIRRAYLDAIFGNMLRFGVQAQDEVDRG